jgi:hypothetical protein
MHACMHSRAYLSEAWGGRADVCRLVLSALSQDRGGLRRTYHSTTKGSGDATMEPSYLILSTVLVRSAMAEHAC